MSPGPSAGVSAAVFSPDGRTLVIGGWDNQVWVRDLATGKVDAAGLDLAVDELVAWSALPGASFGLPIAWACGTKPVL